MTAAQVVRGEHVATSKRLQAGAAVGAIVLLGGAWFLTVRGEDGAASSPTTSSTSTTAPARTTTTSPDDPKTATALRFTDQTKAAGLDAPQAASTPLVWDGFVGGVAVADYDGDGDQDAYLTRIGLPNRLMRNDGKGHFTDVAAEAGAGGADQRNGYAAAVWADVDGDADLDLFLTGAGTGAAELLVNDGKGHFADGTAAAGLSGLQGKGIGKTLSYGAALSDWDHDGDLDLVALQWYRAPWDRQLLTAPPPDSASPMCDLSRTRRSQPVPADLPGSGSHLFTNDGSGRFTDVTKASGVAVEQIIGFQPLFTDIDDDGWDDLFITGDYCTSRLYRNVQGTFTDITESAHVGTDQNGMGSVVADLDGDGNLDWFVSSIANQAPGPCAKDAPCQAAGNRLYLGDGKGAFRDATDELGVREGSWGWGAAGADLDQDGQLDLALANGTHFKTEGPSTDPMLQDTGTADQDPTRLWANPGPGTTPWPEVASSAGVRDRANGKGLVAFDADGDGDLDLLIANTGAAPTYYRNDTPAKRSGHWLQLRLRAPGTANPYAIGAQVTVRLGADVPPRTLTVLAGGSYQSGDPTDLHVGLGDVEKVERIEVRWPGDPTVQVLSGVAADQVLTVTKR